MTLSRRALLPILVAAALLLVCLLFWPFILQQIITPIALLLWLLLRLFVLSIDQRYFWGALIFLAFIFIYSLLPQPANTISTETGPESNEAIQNIEFWRDIFTLIDYNPQDEKTLKRELTRLLAALYAARQQTTPDFLLYEALERGELPLPPHIHAFLFPPAPVRSPNPIARFLQTTRAAARKWIRRRTGQERAEIYAMINDILTFMENSDDTR